jgi:uncharacterized repeat protein (TIGR02059 family)
MKSFARRGKTRLLRAASKATAFVGAMSKMWKFAVASALIFGLAITGSVAFPQSASAAPPPAPTAANVKVSPDGTKIIMTFSLQDMAAKVALPEHFAVTIGTYEAPTTRTVVVPVTNVARTANRDITLTLDGVIDHNKPPRVVYTAPENIAGADNDALQNTAGEDVASFDVTSTGTQSLVPAILFSTPPTLQSSGNVIKLTYSLALAAAPGIPSPSSFSVVTGEGVDNPVIGVTRPTNTTIDLTLRDGVLAGTPVKVSYTAPAVNNAVATNPAIQGTAGNDAQSFSDLTVTNTASLVPTLQSAAVLATGNQIDMTFSAALGTTTAPASAFTVTHSGIPVPVSTASVVSGKLRLTLSRNVGPLEPVVVSYIAPAYNSATNNAAVQATGGQDTPSFSNFVVGSNSSGAPYVTGTSTSTSGQYIFLDYNEPLANTASLQSLFTVRIDGVDRTVSATSFPTTQRLRLELPQPYIELYEQVTVSYMPTTWSAATTNAVVQDTGGSDAPAMSGFVVTNNSTRDTKPPVIQSAVLSSNGTTLTMTYNEPLRAQTVGETRFVLRVDGVDIGNPRSAVIPSSPGNTAVLTLWEPIGSGQVVALSYTGGWFTNAMFARAAASQAYDTVPNLTRYPVVNLSTVDKTPPVLQSVVVPESGDRLVLSYDEALGSVVPGPAAFSVTVNGVTWVPTSVSVSGSDLILTGPAIIEPGLTVVLARYTAPAVNGATTNAAIQDVSGNDAAGLTNVAVTNNSTLDITRPVWQSAVVDESGTSVTLTFDEALSEEASALPLASAFSVGNPGSPSYPVTVTGVVVSGTTVVLTLDNPVGADRLVTFSYTAPASVAGTGNAAIQDVAGNDSLTLTARAVTNNSTVDQTAPLLESAVVSEDGLTVTLKYDDTLSSTGAPVEAFTVQVDGQSQTVSSVVISGDSVILTMASVIGMGKTVTVGYEAPAVDASTTNAATQDLNGNDSATFSGLTATNNSTQDRTPPTLLTAGSDKPVVDSAGTTLTLTFDEVLEAASTAGPGSYTVLVDGVAVAVDAVSVNGATVELTLSAAIEARSIVTVSYLAPVADQAATNEAIQDPAGNDAVSFTGIEVLNNSIIDTVRPELFESGLNAPVVSPNGLTLTLTYNESLNTTTAARPLAGQFIVTADGNTIAVSGVEVSGDKVILTFAEPIGRNFVVSIDYEAPTSDNGPTNAAIQDVTGNDAVSFSTVTVTNNSTVDRTPPVFSSGALGTNGTTLTLTYNESLNTTTAARPLASQFVVTSAGNTIPVSSVSVSGSTVTLTLASAGFSGAEILVTYNPPTPDSSATNAAIQDVAGNDAASLTNQVVTNSSTQGPPAYVSGQVQSTGTSISVTLSKVLNSITGASPTSFTFYSNGAIVKCSNVSNWFASPLVFNSCSPVIQQGATVTVSYVPAAGEALSSGGLKVEQFLDQPVTNGSTQPADTVAPTLSTIVMTGTAGTTIELTYDENLGGLKPTPEMFIIKAGDGSADTLIPVRTVTVSGTKVTLVLDGVIEKDYVVTLEYQAPDPSDNWASNAAIQDVTGNDAASIPATTLTNTSTVIVDRTPPVLQSITTNTAGTQILLNYDELLRSTTALPADFVITLGGVDITPTAVSVSGTSVVLTVGVTISNVDTFTVSYTAPEATVSPSNNAIQDVTGNDAASIPNTFPTTNNSTVGPDIIPPTVSSVAFNGTSVTLTFSEPLGTTTAPASAYTVFVGNDPVSVAATDPVVSGNTVTFQLVDPVPTGSLVSVSYTAPAPDADLSSPDPSNAAVQDIRGNDARSFDVSTQPSNTAWNWVMDPVNSAQCTGNQMADSARQRTLPNGITYSIGVSGDFVCVDAPDATLANRGGINEHFTSTGLVTEPTVGIFSHPPASSVGCHKTPIYDAVNNVTTCRDRGFVTVRFAQPVTDPVISFAGWGSYSGSIRSWQTMNLASPGVTLQYLSGPNIAVVNNDIELLKTPVTTTCTGGNGSTVFNAGCGSIKVLGTVSEVRFSVDFHVAGDRTAAGSSWGHMDYWNMVASVTEDFGLVPMGYENPIAAHVVGSLKLGNTVDADNLSRLYSEYNDDAVAAGSAITEATVGANKYDDGVSVWSSNPSLAMVPGETYSVPVSVQGVEAGRTANLCGWIDFNRDGVFSIGERACTPAITTAGSSTQTLTWTIPEGVVPGQTYSRIRLSYDPIPVATGRVGSGEVEDYSFIILSGSIPQSFNDFSSGELDQVQTFNPLSNDQFEADRPPNPATLKLCGIDPAQTPDNCTLTTLSVPGEGTYTVDPATGEVTFTPEPGYSGTATPIRYQVAETGDDPQTRSALIQVTVNPAPVVVPPPPTATPDETSGPWDTNQSINVLTNDAGTSDSAAPGAELVVSSLTIACDIEAKDCFETRDTDGVVTKVTVPGQGEYTLDTTTGVITFDPLPTFVGEAYPVAYTVSDNFDQSVSSTYTPTVIAPPAAADDTPAAGPHNTPQNINVLANDTVSLTGSAFVLTSVRFCQVDDPATEGINEAQAPDNCTATSVTIPGEGTYTVDTTTGVVTFTPDPLFHGTVATPVQYQVADGDGQIVSALITPSVMPAPPTATPDTTTGAWDETQSINVVTNTAGTSDAAGPGAVLEPSTLTISCAGAASCTETKDADGVVTKVTIAGQGSYTISAEGVVSFEPLATFEGTATPVTYTVEDNFGQPVSTTYTPTVAPPPVSAVDDISSGPWDTNQTISPLGNDPHNENFDFVNSTLKLCGISPVETPDNCSKTELIVPNEGTYTVNSDGTVTFDPLPSFTGTATPINYQVADSLGRVVDATIRVTVGEPPPPVAANDTSSGPWDTNQVLDPLTGSDTAGAPEFPLKADTVRFCQVDDPTTPDINEAQSPDGCTATSVTIPGEGTYTVNTTTGVVTFDPLPTFTGTVQTPVVYQVEDTLGRVVNATITPTVTPPPPPSAEDDETSGKQGVPQTIDLLANDDPYDASIPLVPSSVVLSCAPFAVDCSVTEGVVTIAGVGTYAMDPAKPGFIIFTPVPEFTGIAPSVVYTVKDSLGGEATATYTPTVVPSPVAVPDALTGPYDTNQVYTPLSNDTVPNGGAALSPASLTLCDPNTDPAEVAPSCASTSVTIPGEGTYTVVYLLDAEDTTKVTGVQVVFDPLPTFSGTVATPVVYQVSDEADAELRQTVHTTITPTVAPPGVSAVDDVSSGDWDTNQTIRPLANDPHDDNFDLDNASLKLCGIDPLEIPVDCSLTTLVVPGEGTYTVNADGTVTFDPLPTFTGDATPIRYQVSDSLDRVVDAMIRVTVGEPPLPVAVDDISFGVWDANQTISPLTNDPHNTNFPLQPATLKLCQVDDPATTQVNEAEVPDNCTATSVTIPGEGTYTVNPDGTVTFDPLPSFVGTVATPVTYQVEDSLERVVNATITPTVGPPPAPAAEPVTSSGPQDVNQVFDPTVNDTAGSTQFPLDQTTVKFCGVDDPATTTVDESQPPHCTATTLIVPGEGTYTVHPVTGVVTFDPEPDFVGTATPITYQISDTYGNTASSTITPTVVGRPTAVDDATSGPFNQPQSDSVLSDDSAATGATLEPSSLTLMDGSTPVTSVTATSGGVTQGVYTLGPDNTIVFTPEPGFVGTATPVTYRVTDSLGQTATATYTPTIDPPALPVMVPDTSSGPYQTAQTKDVLDNDTLPTGVTWEPNSLTLVGAAADGSVTALATDGSVQGVYTVVNDEIVFTPADGFVGEATPVTYEAEDSLGRVGSSTYTPTVTPPPAPVAVNDTSSGFINVAQSDNVVSDDTSSTGVPISSSTIKLLDPATGLYGTSPVTTPEGTYSIVDGKVQFQPVTDFVGTATPVTYQIADSVGQTATATYTPTVIGPPDAIDDTPAAGPFNTVQNIPILANDIKAPTDAAFNPTTVVLRNAAGEFVTSVTTADGTYVANSDGTVTFTPRDGFVGVVTEPVTYRVADMDGQLVTAVITPSVVGPPVAVDDATSGPFNQPQSDSVLSDDRAATGATLEPSSLTLMDGSTPVTSVTALAGDGTTVQGVYTLGANNTVVFTPEPGFVGTATPVTYRVTDSLGQTATATYTPTINPPPPPVADPDETSGPFNTAQTMDVVVNDASFTGVPISDLTIKLFDGTSYVTTPVTTADGVYSIVGGEIKFQPNTGFVGEAAPITYQIADSVGQTATTTYTPTVIGPPVAVNDATSGPFNQSQSEDVLGNDGAANGATLVPGTLRLVVPGEFGVFTLGETVTVEDGVYRIDENGHIEFTPNDGFVGTADPVTYQVTDSLGQTVTATYTPTIDPAALPVMVPDTSSGPYRGTQTKDVLDNDTLPAGVTWRPETLTLVGAAPDGSVTVTGDKTAPDGTVTTGTQGVYTVVDGKIVFTPEPDFVGTATPVTYQATDSLGRTGSTTYTPTVDPIPVPAAVPDRTIGPLDQPQSHFVLLNDDPGPGAELDGTHLRLWDPVLKEWTNTVTALAPDGTVQGTYTIRVVGNPRIEIVFTPVTGFVGVATPVTYEMANNFGQVATTTYTPEIRTDPPPSPVVRAAEVVVATLVRTGLGSLAGALALVGGLLGVGAVALVAARRSRTLANKD